MSVSIWFEAFNNNLLIDVGEVETISYRYKRITKQLNKDFYNSESDIAHSFYVGSYGRGTDIHVSDIDMIFQLPYSTFEQYNNYSINKQSSLLQAVKNSIDKTIYPTYLRADGQVIKLDFSDGINFEIVPAFLNRDGSYTYPDSNNGGTWKTTNPKPEINEMTSKNFEWNKNLKRLCRMTRSWKDNCNVAMGGLLIDTLAYNFMKDWSNKDKSYLYYDFLSRDFFKYLSEQSATQSYWLSPGAGQYVWRSGNFEYKSKQAYNLALEAISKENYHTTAKSKWREIYGTTFPS